jgi:hypothetical protein
MDEKHEHLWVAWQSHTPYVYVSHDVVGFWATVHGEQKDACPPPGY